MKRKDSEPQAGESKSDNQDLEKRGFLQALEHPKYIFANLGPNWFAVVMGTGIVANAAAVLPIQFVGLRTFSLVMWVISAVLLVFISLAWLVHWLFFRQNLRNYIHDPVLAQFYGAPPMAILTVGLGAMLVGKDLIGAEAALVVDWILWPIGTVLGILSAIIVPYTMFTRGESKLDGAFGGWLMPIVPPMVSANAAAVLVPSLPEGQAQLNFLMIAYALFGVSIFASVIIIALIWSRMILLPLLPALLIPTLWIVLGPLGQSITAANNLGGAEVAAIPGPFDDVMLAFGLLYGIPTWGFAIFWAILASAITIKVAKERLPFGMTWWSFTFPVGTVVTGTAALAVRSGSEFFSVASLVLFIALVFAWATVTIHTATNGFRGTLFLPGPQQAAALIERAEHKANAKESKKSDQKPKKL